MEENILWRFLIVDDRQADEVRDFIDESLVLDHPNKVVIETCKKFNDAIEMLNRIRIDLVILDIKDQADIRDDDDNLLAGQEVFEKIRDSRFVPVIFHTAYPHKVKNLENPYVRVVERSRPRDLLAAIKDVLETGLPQFNRFLESEQRRYMWGQVLNNWKEFESSNDKIDLTYLLARRLANTLQTDSARRFLNGENTTAPQKTDAAVYPIEMYIYPSTNPKLSAGDILKGKFLDKDSYWIVLTPSCDLEQNKVSHVILAACVKISDQPEAKKIFDAVKNGQPISETSKKELAALIGNNRQVKNVQAERYNFLPGTFFIPDLIVDFQELIRVSINEIKDANRIALLDSPFAEACLARFTRYYGRLGTPDVNTDFVTNNILKTIKQEVGK
jgi:DNA-binding response OmpR family regulator